MTPDRRTVLRGFGTALALPFLESLAPARGRADRPLRLAFVYAPNGVHVPAWRIAEEGPLGALPFTLEPLEDLRASLTVVSGLTHDKGRANGDGPGDHARAASTWLTGVQPLKTDGRVRLGVSADQVAAARLGEATRVRSLVLGGEPGRSAGQCDSGYACAYSGHVSWEGPETPCGKEVDPRRVFDRLFRGGEDAADQAARMQRLERRRSVLDFVREDARALDARLSAADRAQLDEYLTGVRELERRLAAAFPERVDSVPDEARPPAEPGDFATRAHLLADLVVLAFRADVTRVATWMIANEGSNRSYPELGVREGHHALSHHQGDAEKQEQIRRIDRHHVELAAHLVRGLAAAEDGGGRLLDATLVVYGSGLADGNAHAHHDLPLFVAGHGNGALAGGRHVRFPKETPLMDLCLWLLARAGVPVERLGDSSGPLALS